jgi:hypothetical protein
VAAEKGFEQFARTTKKVSSDRHPIDLWKVQIKMSEWFVWIWPDFASISTSQNTKTYFEHWASKW